MMSSLERVWSDALDTEPAAKAREEAAGVWQSFVTAFFQWNERMARAADQLGAVKTMERFPLDEAGMARLELEPSDPALRYHQLAVATIYAVQGLMDALEGLREPTAYRVELLPAQRMETWWEAGAFSIVRARADALASILRHQEACLRELAEGSGVAVDIPSRGVVSWSSDWIGPLGTAANLTSRGLHAAALPYLLSALRTVLAEAAGVDVKVLPAPLAPRLVTVSALSALAEPVALLEAASRRFGEGRDVDPGVAVPLAEELGRLFRELAFNPPGRNALGALIVDEGPEDG